MGDEEPALESNVGDDTQQCPRVREIRVRVTTLNYQEQPRGDAIGRHWNQRVNTAIDSANQVFSPHGIYVVRSRRRDLGVDHSRSLLTSDIRAAAAPGRYRATVEDWHDRGRSQYEESGSVHHLSRAYWANVSQMAMAFESGAGLAGSEVRAILRLNRAPREVATYWVPGISSSHEATAHTFFGPLYSDINRTNEGILMAPHAGSDTLAHELGHLLMRAGHRSFQPPNGEQEGSAGPDNIMHSRGDLRTGRNLTAGQLREIRRRGRYYLRYHRRSSQTAGVTQ